MSSMDSLTLHNNSEVTEYIFPELGVVCVCVCAAGAILMDCLTIHWLFYITEVCTSVLVSEILVFS